MNGEKRWTPFGVRRFIFNETSSANASCAGITPRSALQKIGNEMFRAHIANDIWLKRAQKEIQASDQSVVISDCRCEVSCKRVSPARGPWPLNKKRVAVSDRSPRRFPHEVEFIHSIGGKIIYVQRDTAEMAIPEWVRDLVPVATEGDWKKIRAAGFHDSDTCLYGLIDKADILIENNGTLEELDFALRGDVMEDLF